jgi:lipopolysaccharide export system permease protein
MRILTRYFASQIYGAVGFTMVVFLALFSFFDLMTELGALGQGPFQLEHAILFVALGLPAYAYELMPIVVLIGTIYVMAQLAARSEFTVMRASSLSMSNVLLLLLKIGLIFSLMTFILGEVIAPKSSEFRDHFKRRLMGSAISAEFRSGLWAKDVVRNTSTGEVIGSRFLNARGIEPDGAIRDVSVFEFDAKMHMTSRLTARYGYFQAEGALTLSEVDEVRFSTPPGDQVSPVTLVAAHRHLPTVQIPSEITSDILAVMLTDPKRMSSLDLSRYSSHLKQNNQRSERYDIALWAKLLYPMTSLVMMVMALPFAYLKVRAGSLSLKVFVGIMIGMTFHLLNNLFSHIGLLNTWPPFATAVLPSLLFLLAAVAALRWVERH